MNKKTLVLLSIATLTSTLAFGTDTETTNDQKLMSPAVPMQETMELISNTIQKELPNAITGKTVLSRHDKMTLMQIRTKFTLPYSGENVVAKCDAITKNLNSINGQLFKELPKYVDAIYGTSFCTHIGDKFKMKIIIIPNVAKNTTPSRGGPEWAI